MFPFDRHDAAGLVDHTPVATACAPAHSVTAIAADWLGVGAGHGVQPLDDVPPVERLHDALRDPVAIGIIRLRHRAAHVDDEYRAVPFQLVVVDFVAPTVVEEHTRTLLPGVHLVLQSNRRRILLRHHEPEGSTPGICRCRPYASEPIRFRDPANPT